MVEEVNEFKMHKSDKMLMTKREEIEKNILILK